MDEILEKFVDLGLHKTEETNEIDKGLITNYYLNKTGFCFDSSNSSQSVSIKSAFNILEKDCLDHCARVEPRLLKDEEKEDLPANFLLNDSNSHLLGSCLQLLDQILYENLNNGFVFCNQPDNFQIENFLIKATLKTHVLKRILFINLNSHHNTNVQTEFYQNKKVLTMSVHQTATENSIDSDFHMVGDEEAKGFNINLNLNQCYVGDTEVLLSFFNLFLPIAYEFNPELVIVSTNFNFVSDSLKPNFSASVFAHLLHYLSGVANGKLCLMVKGENVSTSFNESCLLSLRALLGFPSPVLNGLNQPDKKFVQTLHKSIAVLRPYWCCLQLLNENDEINLTEFIENEKNKLTKENEAVKEENGKKEEESKPTDIKVEELVDCVQNLDLAVPLSRTCLCTDVEMMLHENLIEKNHPERPDRIKRIIEMLKEKNLYDRCVELKSRCATDDELELCHKAAYIKKLKKLRMKSAQELIEMSMNPHSVYYHSQTFDCATLATGCVLKVVEGVCSKKFTNGVAVCRPPGHHANADSSSGFCFFNSIAVAARYAQKNFPFVKKVLILDFDVHHGNGTQEIFENDDSVLFISLHRYNEGLFYPAGAPSNFDCIGGDKAKGFTVNVPWNLTSAGDAEYTAAFLRVVMPVAYEFNPDLVLVSAGFDAALGDPLGNFHITPSGFAQMTKMLSSLANGKIVLALEGGYNLNSISESMSACVSVLLGDICPSLPPINAKPQAYKSIKSVIGALKPYWKCLQFDDNLPTCEFVKNFKTIDRQMKESSVKPSENRYTLRNRIKHKDGIDSPNSPSSPCRNLSPKVSKMTPKKQTETPVSSVKTPIIKEKLSSNTNTPTTRASSARAVLETRTPASNSCCGDLNQIQLTVEIEDQSAPFAVVPLPFCPHLLEIHTNPQKEQIDAYKPCQRCSNDKENWICLTCFECFCSRFVKGHMLQHFNEKSHPMCLSFSDMSVWCYVCDSYVHNEMLSNVKEIAYNSKFPSD